VLSYPLMLHDIFICHASEDKEPFVRELAATLRERHIEVWYDDFTLSVGDSLRRAIDRGLGNSRFGAIILSPAFFAKQWPQYELDGLLQRELDARTTVLLPVWLDVSQADVMKYAPSLAGRFAALAHRGVRDVAARLIQVIRPQGSPLVFARDFLVGYDVSPPVVTDEYWLDVVEASNRLPNSGIRIPAEASWQRWAFPLPENDGTAEGRGERLAWTALQLEWTRRADEEGISVTSRPEDVLTFVQSCPGLLDTANAFPRLLAEYAPQLTIPGFGGDFEELFEEEYQTSLSDCASRRGQGALRWGSAVTTTGVSPLCDGVWALRSPTFGDYDPPLVAEDYFHGGEFGPPVAKWADADHLFWLLSAASTWLPTAIRDVLLDGLIRNTRAWPWDGAEFAWPNGGQLKAEILERKRNAPTANAKTDILGRASLARERLRLPETPQSLAERFIEEHVVQRCIREDRLDRRRLAKDKRR
jgi:hypothetical protein